ncbi:cadherin repeat domain-containing protein [uncultured Pseudoteredinibacter sp.]|uniref:cadherin repeat domain-containing protein n=1 Tax=uncultured Pseudoteredinibacter sp. TaxID=1641701 RepID=UPI002621104D|nr:cadherin repeat domain-containing protein [uncultured Pseudoteredinibacter sp.]
MHKLSSILGVMATALPLQLAATTLTINGVTYNAPGGSNFNNIQVQHSNNSVVLTTEPAFLLDYVQPIADTDSGNNDYDPVFKLSTQNFSVADGATTVGTVEAMDGDDDSGTISFTELTDAGNLFEVSPTGEITFTDPNGAVFVNGGNNVHFLGLQASDNDSGGTPRTAQTLVRVEITDGSAPANTAPTFAAGNQYSYTIANGASGTIGTITATDVETGITYSLTGADAAAFSINGSGVLSLTQAANHSVKSSYSLAVIAADTGSPVLQTTSPTITVNVSAPTGGGGGACGPTPSNVELKAAINLATPGTQDRVTMTPSKVTSIPLNTSTNPTYSGQIAIASTTGNSHVTRNVWLSTCPGIADDLSTNTTYTECHSTGNSTTVVKFRQTGTGDFRTCGLDVNTTYYLNVENQNCNTGQCDVYRAIYTKGTP